MEVEDYDDEDDSDVEMDIRALVGKSSKNKGSDEFPPAKKQRKS